MKKHKIAVDKFLYGIGIKSISMTTQISALLRYKTMKIKLTSNIDSYRGDEHIEGITEEKYINN